MFSIVYVLQRCVKWEEYLLKIHLSIEYRRRINGTKFSRVLNFAILRIFGLFVIINTCETLFFGVPAKTNPREIF